MIYLIWMKRLLWLVFVWFPIGVMAFIIAPSYLLDAAFWGGLIHAAAYFVAFFGGVWFLSLFLWEYKTRKTTKFGEASFAGRKDIKRMGLYNRQGLVLGKAGGRTLRFCDDGHLLTFAPTRSGKGVGCVIPNLLTHEGSVVVTDIKGENYAITHRHRERMSKVFAIAPFNQAINGARYNPLDFVRIGTPEDIDDAALIAEMLVPSEGAESFWDSEAKNLIGALVLFVATDFSDRKRNLHNIWRLLMRDSEGFEELIIEMQASGHDAVRKAADGFSQKEERERSGVISTAQTRMKIWRSIRLAEATATSDFCMEDIKRDIVSLYLVIPPELVSVYQPFMRLMVGLSVAAMTRVGGYPKERIVFFLDEVSALGRMIPIEKGIGFLAGYGVSLWLFFQDMDQIKKTYPKWRSMIANCTIRQAFGVADAQTAAEISAMLGERTVKVESRGHSGEFFIPMKTKAQKSISETARPLLTLDQVLTMPHRRQVIFVRSYKPVYAVKVRYYEDPAYRGRHDEWNRP